MIRVDSSSASESDGDFCGDLFSKKLNLSEIRVDSSASSDSDSSWDDDRQAEDACDEFEDDRFGGAPSDLPQRLVQQHRDSNAVEFLSDSASDDVHHSEYEQDLHHSLSPSASNISDKSGTESNERRENRDCDQYARSENQHHTLSDNINDSDVISTDRQTKRKYLVRLTGPQSFKVKRRRISESMQGRHAIQFRRLIISY